MKRVLLIAALFLLSLSPLSQAHAVSLENTGKLPPSRTDMPDKSQEDDCDCCAKCKAAQKPEQSREEKGGDSHNNGCEECCERCGRRVPTSPEEAPPDIIEKSKGGGTP